MALDIGWVLALCAFKAVLLCNLWRHSATNTELASIAVLKRRTGMAHNSASAAQLLVAHAGLVSLNLELDWAWPRIVLDVTYWIKVLALARVDNLLGNHPPACMSTNMDNQGSEGITVLSAVAPFFAIVVVLLLLGCCSCCRCCVSHCCTRCCARPGFRTQLARFATELCLLFFVAGAQLGARAFAGRMPATATGRRHQNRQPTPFGSVATTTWRRNRWTSLV